MTLYDGFWAELAALWRVLAAQPSLCGHLLVALFLSIACLDTHVVFHIAAYIAERAYKRSYMHCSCCL